MKLTQQCLNNPTAVIIVTLMLLVLGVLSLVKIPAQLLPNIEKPVITVISNWPGASPAETESELTVPIEEVLVGTPGMTDMVAWSMADFGFMQLEFSLETDMTRALIDVISRLNRLRPLPANAQRPQIMMGEWGDANDTLIEYFIQNDLALSKTEREANSKYMRDVILPELQALYGVSRIEFDDGTWGDGEQLQIIFDIFKAADLGIDIARIPQLIGRSQDLSSGFVDVGRKQYTLRFEGRYDVEELANVILESRDGVEIRLGDLARIEVGPGRAGGFIYQNGNPAFRLSVSKTNEANVLEALDGIKAKMAELNDGVFAERGMQAQYSFDPGRYIKRSMGLLSSNLVVGMLFAVSVLWLFLRQWRATLLIATAIPISLLTTFIILNLTGRSMNVISLAGLAFASGMVLDAAIVVLENIVRLREKGESLTVASDKGATQVWGALLASTATTVAIFIPIMFLEDAEGQMFADLAMTIAIGVSVSLVVAITILPTGARYLMRDLPTENAQIKPQKWDKIADLLMVLSNSQTKRVGWIAFLIVVPVTITIFAWPSSNYLPPVKRDTVDSFLFFPPGTNVKTADKEIAQVIGERLAPKLNGEQTPAIRDYFFWSFPGASGGWLAINGEEGTDLDALQQSVQTEVISGIPDMFGFSMRRSLFGGFSDSNSVRMEITTTDLQAAKQAAMAGMGMIMQGIPGATANPEPDPFSESTEMRFVPKDSRLQEVGWSRSDLSNVIMELGQGAWMGEYFDGMQRMDIFLKTERFDTPEQIAALPVKTPNAGVIPLSELVDVSLTLAPSAIVRMDRKRGYSLNVNPPPDMSLEQLIDALETQIEPALRGQLPSDAQIKYSGSAEDLARAMTTLSVNFVMAFLLLLLIMAGLFKSLGSAVQVCIALPLASFGGVVALNLLNLIRFQPLDLLGMIGFIILLGLVVNNAILLVAQTREGLTEGLSVEDAVHNALRLRLRPIFMSTLTSLFGMLPLLLFPGAGSDIYRGMAAAIVGGMSVSTIFTLILLPCLLQLSLSSRKSEPDPL
ncbi:efflux RND transporter permease subunit [Alteromonas sediminis]|uniref:Efflux RND transporter permease subunit n=1 Tax=Alteromonas sediminis TaxID=2259342 RepID=A0A3N5YF77_9ALTE|nr:efflux RND transporter permease subunit [Alteromonas sediminis]RPJ68625.1 efflux RND transporter permease subunit [Alteromonas sediminis]